MKLKNFSFLDKLKSKITQINSSGLLKKKPFFSWFKKKKVFFKKIFFGGAVALTAFFAIWVRVYHFGDWLYFKSDQAKNAFIISGALEKGIDKLPLLGPRVDARVKMADDYLNLGPIYYYFQYFSRLIFNSTEPWVFAFPDLLFSILILPLFYLFLRINFSKRHSLIGVILYAFSFLIVQCSRFSWPMNGLPFFILLAFYSLIRAVSESRFQKKILFCTLWACGVAVSSQLHIFGLFLGLFVSVAFLFFRFKIYRFYFLKNYLVNFFSFSRKLWLYPLVTLFVLAFFYFPMITYEVKNDYQNSQTFMLYLEQVFTSGVAEPNYLNKFIRNFKNQAEYFILIITSFQSRAGWKADPLVIAPGLIFIFAAFNLLFFQMDSQKKILKKDFWLLLLTWFSIFILISVPYAYELKPKFFTGVFPLVIAIVISWIVFLENLSKKRFLSVFTTFCLVLTLLLLNFYNLKNWFNEQKLSEKNSFPVFKTIILKQKDGVTLAGLKNVALYLNSQKNAQGKIIFYAKPEYRLPLEYLLIYWLKNKSESIIILKKTVDLKNAFINSSSFRSAPSFLAVVSSRGDIDSISKDFLPLLNLENVQKNSLGQLSVWRFDLLPEKLLE